MIELSTARSLFKYSDWANEQLVKAAAGLPADLLDREFDIGRGSLRKTLLHILAGESVWLKRWQGHRDTPWPDESESASPSLIWDRFRELFPQRDRFLADLRPEHYGHPIIYRDSKGSLFSAALADMILQMFTHSMHHRSQGVNILRRLGDSPLELDYMMWLRKPA